MEFAGVFGSESYTLSIKNRNVEEHGLVNDTLCSRCRMGTAYRRRGRLDVMTFCGNSGRPVPPDIVECSRFMDRKTLSLDEMSMIAREIDPRIGVKDGSFL